MSPILGSGPERECAREVLASLSPERVAMEMLMKAADEKRVIVGLGEWCQLVSIEGRRTELKCVGGMIVSGISLQTLLDVYPPVSPWGETTLLIDDLMRQAERLGEAWGVGIDLNPNEQTIALRARGENFTLSLRKTPFSPGSGYFQRGILENPRRELLMAAMALPSGLFRWLRRDGLLFQDGGFYPLIAVPGSILRHEWREADENICYPMDLAYGEKAKTFLFKHQNRIHPTLFRLLP